MTLIKLIKHLFMKVNLIWDANETTWSFQRRLVYFRFIFHVQTKVYPSSNKHSEVKFWKVRFAIICCIRTEVWKDNKSEETRTLLQWRGHVSLKIRHAKSDLGTIHTVRNTVLNWVGGLRKWAFLLTIST